MSMKYNQDGTRRLFGERAFLLLGVLFQLIFLFELIVLYQFIVIDPRVHQITPENWFWFIEWTPPVYWTQHFNTIVATAHWINLVFQLAFGLLIVYVFLKNQKFSLKRKHILITILCLVLFCTLVHFYIRYCVAFYRLYMYAIPTEIFSFYIMYCGRRLKDT